MYICGLCEHGWLISCGALSNVLVRCCGTAAVGPVEPLQFLIGVDPRSGLE